MKAWHLRGQVKVGSYTLSQPVLHCVTDIPVPDSHTYTQTQKQTADLGTHSQGKFHQHFMAPILPNKNSSTISILKLKRVRGSAPYKWTLQGLQRQNLNNTAVLFTLLLKSKAVLEQERPALLQSLHKVTEINKETFSWILLMFKPLR